MISISQLETNVGQIKDVPTNPRSITEERKEALKKSISELPDMLSLRELIVYPHNDKFVVLCGNMRFEACKELGWNEMPCKVLSQETQAEKLRRIVMVDNEEFGQTDWEVIQLAWDIDEMKEWGVEIPSFLVSEDVIFDFSTPDGLDEEKDDKPFAVKMTFETRTDFDDFLENYRQGIIDEFGCTINRL